MLKKYIKAEVSGWTKLEILWLIIATAVILYVPIFSKDTLCGIIAALTGVWCVILTGKGKLSSFIVGTVNTVLYAYVAYKAKYYGDVMLNLLYYLPCNVIGLFAWKKHFNEEEGEVKMESMKLSNALLTFLISGAAVFGYGLILKKLGGNAPFVDAASTVLSVVAQILCIKRFSQQWIIWIVVDGVTILMWVLAFFNGGESLATLLCWIVYFLNAIFMYVKWERKAKHAV